MTSPPPRRPLTLSPRGNGPQAEILTCHWPTRWAVSSPTPAVAARGTYTFCLSRLGGHFPFHGYFASKPKSRSSAGFIVSARYRLPLIFGVASSYFGSLGVQFGLFSVFGGLFLGCFFGFFFFQAGSFLFGVFITDGIYRLAVELNSC